MKLEQAPFTSLALLFMFLTSRNHQMIDGDTNYVMQVVWKRVAPENSLGLSEQQLASVCRCIESMNFVYEF